MVILLAFVALASHPRMLQVQEPQQEEQSLTLSQSTAKAQTVMDQVITALGGQAFLGIRDSDCNGNMSEFGRSGEVVVYAPVREMRIVPDRVRFEYTSPTQKLITVFSGGGGWFLSKQGVFDEPQDEIAAFADQTQMSMDTILRLSAEGKGLVFRFAGKSTIDHQEAEWIEVADFDGHEIRLGVDVATHLPIVWKVVSQNTDTGDRIENVIQYMHYALNDAIQTPLIVSHEQNGRLISQNVFSACKYNTDLSPNLFTRDSLLQDRDKIGRKNRIPAN